MMRPSIKSIRERERRGKGGSKEEGMGRGEEV
jgi:hypothetical protein